LTACHVWEEELRKAEEEELRKAEKVGLTLREGDVHQLYIDINTIVATGLPEPNEWNPWGPDLVFLRIPPEHVGSLKAFRVFYATPKTSPQIPTAEYIQMWALIGAPAARSASPLQSRDMAAKRRDPETPSAPW
jgi:hypothetical protein